MATLGVAFNDPLVPLICLVTELYFPGLYTPAVNLLPYVLAGL